MFGFGMTNVDEKALAESSHVGRELGFDKRAETFRRFIFEDYDFLDAARRNSRQYEQATFSTDDVKTSAQRMELMSVMPQGLVGFSTYGHKKAPDPTPETEVIREDYRARRFWTRMRNYPPLDIWSRWILTSNFFSGLMISVIILNSLVIMAEGGTNQQEFEDTSDNRVYREAIDTLDFLFLAIFCADIYFKFMDAGFDFFNVWWNLFDLGVTTGSLVAVLIDLIYQDAETNFGAVLSFVHYIRVFRILRSLNVVTRWKRIRLLWIAVMSTVTSLMYILVLMSVFYYIFALVGIQIFDRFTQSHISDLEYHKAFGNLGYSYITLFQLFTLDHWYKLIVSLSRVQGAVVPSLFCLSWILLGSFIFRNIFVGVMVKNFQNIRRELMEEESKQGKRKITFAVDLTNLDFDEFRTIGEPEEADAIIDFEKNVFFDLTILRYLNNRLSPVLFPRDTLLHYFVILEGFARNMDDREQLLRLLNQALIQNYDN